VKSILCSVVLFSALVAPAAAFPDRLVLIGTQGHGADVKTAYDDALSTLRYRCTDVGGIRFDGPVVGNIQQRQTDGGWLVTLDMNIFCVIPT